MYQAWGLAHGWNYGYRYVQGVRSGCVYFLLCRSCGQCSEIEMEIKFQFKSEIKMQIND